MYLKKPKPITPGLRHQINVDKTACSNEKPLKNHTLRLKNRAGRNSSGTISINHRGSRPRRIYRKYYNWNHSLCGIITAITYDPNTNSYTARILDTLTKKSTYIRGTSATSVGTLCGYGPTVGYRIGNRKPLKNIPSGALVSNLSTSLENSGKYARGAGTYCVLLQKGIDSAILRLPSGSLMKCSSSFYATIGIMSNKIVGGEVIGKAGRNRHRGIRPTVRGVAMNPVDHPHGGGEGKTSGGRPSVTPWGRPTKGAPTRRRKKVNIDLVGGVN
jgi:large subunit ribosomal protein L2